MRRRTQSHESFSLPTVVPGEWQGEMFGSVSISLGQVLQPGPPKQAVEFSYIVLPARLTMPKPKFRWPGVIMILAPTPLRSVSADAGRLFVSKGAPSLTLNLIVSRAQFSDMLRVLEKLQLKEFHFTVEANESADSWPIRSWGLALSSPDHS